MLFNMLKIILSLFLVFMLFPINSGFSQSSNTVPTLGIEFTNFSPFHYKTDDGFTVIVGEVKNTKNFPITGIKIWAGYYDEFGDQPIESTIGATVLDVIPPLGKSPYLIKSQNPNPEITNVSVNLLGFNSAVPKVENLNIELTNLNVGEKIKLSGSITNTNIGGNITTLNARAGASMQDTFVNGTVGSFNIETDANGNPLANVVNVEINGVLGSPTAQELAELIQGTLAISGIEINRPPKVILSASPTNGFLPLAVSFSSAGTFDPEGDVPLTFDYTFGDGTSCLICTPNTSHIYAQPAGGTFTATLTVTDPSGASGSASVVITVQPVVINQAPVANDL